MANSLTWRRQEAERQRIAVYDATLKGVSRAARPAPDFEKALAEAHEGLGLAIRLAEDWRPKLKTRDPEKLRLAAARHLFARYPVCAALERVWLGLDELDAAETRLRKRWYVVAAGGGSLWKEEASRWLSRKEVHRFLAAPSDLDFMEALWHAIALSYTDDRAMALRIAKSRLMRTPREQLAFWREAARLFAVNDTAREDIDDLGDFLTACLRDDPAYSLKGRTVASLKRQMQDWHRDLAAINRIDAWRRRAQAQAAPASRAAPDDRRWPGAPIADWNWQPSGKNERASKEAFSISQLRSAADLVMETRAMHHCVATYAGKCIAGQASIWSLKRSARGRGERLLTIELDRQHRAVQVRGFANRLATAEELQVLQRWAKARGVAMM